MPEYYLKRHVSISTHHLLKPWCTNQISCFSCQNNAIRFDCHFHIGCCIYDCNDQLLAWLTIEISYIVLHYNLHDLYWFNTAGCWDLKITSLYTFRYIPVSLLWKWMDVWLNQLTTSCKLLFRYILVVYNHLLL